LHDGVDAITEIPPERWDADALYAPEPAPGKACTRWGGVIDDVDLFDAEFFRISEAEAPTMDPQHRLVLEVGWEALEDAGIAPDSLSGSRTGVFLGISNYDYNRLMARDRGYIDRYAAVGTIQCIAANRLSYLLNLQGPSLAVDTACSSSLVAMDLACDSLRHGQSDLALAGGVNLVLSPEVTISFSQAGIMARDYGCPLPHVLFNAAPPLSLMPTAGTLRAKLGLSSQARIVLYQGWMSPERGIDVLVQAAAHFPAGIHLVLIGYGEAGQVDPVMADAADVFTAHRVRLHDALRVTDDRSFSYLCQDPTCCPPQGTRFDPTSSVIAVSDDAVSVTSAISAPVRLRSAGISPILSTPAGMMNGRASVVGSADVRAA